MVLLHAAARRITSELAIKRRTCLTGLSADNSYDEREYIVGLYKIMVAIWIFLGLASCASFLTTVQETCTAVVWHVEDKAIKLKEKAGIGVDKEDKDSSRDSRKSSSRSRSGHRVAPAESERQSTAHNDADDRIWVT